ncbi:MAG: hypothetical protein M1358_19880 [Chloroflexi bacterium]|nr:hypothetical protein [Chloroflexota bacterium]
MNKERFFNNLVDILYCYWSVQRGMAFLLESGLANEAAGRRFRHDSFIDLIAASEGTSPEEVREHSERGLNPQMMDAKWYADATIAKARALWDKSLMWLSRDYYCAKLYKDNWGDRDGGRIGELLSKVASRLSYGLERTLLGVFISMCCDIEDLRRFRDNDLHKVSPRITEALGREDKDMDMLSLLNMLDHEIGKCSEGLIACFAVVLAGGEKIPNSTAVANSYLRSK